MTALHREAPVDATAEPIPAPIDDPAAGTLHSAAPAADEAAGGCGPCACGGGGCGSAQSAPPVLDARDLDPRIRQSAIFGVLVGMPPSAAVAVVTEDDPQQLIALLHERLPGEYEAYPQQRADGAYDVVVVRP